MYCVVDTGPKFIILKYDVAYREDSSLEPCQESYLGDFQQLCDSLYPATPRANPKPRRPRQGETGSR